MTDEILCLRWNNHLSAFNKLLDNIHLKENYSDGTILCDGTFYPVHSFVLSTCSGYFEEIFQQCSKGPNRHPYIIIRDIDKSQLEAILTYMYKGEVVVPQNTLSDLIKGAEILKVKGLGVREQYSSHTEANKRERSPSPSSETSRTKRSREEKNCTRSANGSSDSDDDLLSKIKFKPTMSLKNSGDFSTADYNVTKTPVPILPKTSMLVKEEQQEPPAEGSNNAVIDESCIKTEITFDCEDPVELSNLDSFNMIMTTECTDESFLAQNSYKPRLEITTNDTGDTVRTFKCPFSSCLYQSSRNSDVWRHFTKHTGYKPYKCPLCNYGTNHTGHLKRHFSRAHKSSNLEDFS